MVSEAVLIGVVLGLTLALEWVVLRLANRPHLLAEVNARSSHEIPTPTMGGVAIWGIGVTYLMLNTAPSAQWLIGALAGIGIVGLWDDLRPLSARFRLAIQIVASAVVVWWLDPTFPWPVFLLLVIGVAWFTNLFNFMDGIDGIAAVQCLVFCLGAQLLVGGVPGWVGDLIWVTAASSLGFLAFNWPPAKIFMGDVGSSYLGFLIATLVLYLWHSEQSPLIASLILLAGFWFDATYTLCVRIVTRQSFTEAHRSHLYQRLAWRYGHLWTTSAFLIFALSWSLPMAWISIQYPSWAYIPLLLVVLPLTVLCYRFQAGARVEDSRVEN